MASAQSKGPFSRLRTQGLAAYNLAWSPFFPNRFAIASSANYGLVGNGRLSIASHLPSQPGQPPPVVQTEKFFETQDGLYDVAWSEIHENQLITASGDGSIKLWDVTLNDHPIRHWQEHAREVFCVDWNNIRKDLFASSSWDSSVRIWHPERPTALTAITSHTACVYACSWSPHNGDLIATACGDGHLRLYDVRASNLGTGSAGSPTQTPVAVVPVGGEVLSVDWNKYRPMTLATGSTDRGVKVWDLRGAGKAGPGIGPGGLRGGENTAALLGHEYAVRKVAFSPHDARSLASASYDMTARVWDIDAGQAMSAGPRIGAAGAGSSLRRIHDGHTEFVVSIGWSLFTPGLVASAAWDTETHLWYA